MNNTSWVLVSGRRCNVVCACVASGVDCSSDCDFVKYVAQHGAVEWLLCCVRVAAVLLVGGRHGICSSMQARVVA